MKQNDNRRSVFKNRFQQENQQHEKSFSNNYLFFINTEQLEFVAVYIQKMLSKLGVITDIEYNHCIYHCFSVNPAVPNEGLLNFYQKLFTASGPTFNMPGVIFLDITSCAMHLNSAEFIALLCFIRSYQYNTSTTFVCLVNNTTENRAEKLIKKMRNIVPVTCFDLSDKEIHNKDIEEQLLLTV